jgi:hypothetical protein
MTRQAVATGARNDICHLHQRKVSANTRLSALSEVFAGLHYPAILGGNAARSEAEGFSYWAADPVEIFL